MTDKEAQTIQQEAAQAAQAASNAVTASFSDIFTYNALVHAIAGTGGGAAAMTTFYPLDVIRTYMQADMSKKKMSTWEAIREIVYPSDESMEGGIGVLYRGLDTTLISLAFSNFIYFYTNNALKVVVRRFTGAKDISTVNNLLIASIAGCVNVMTTCPLWVVCTRIKLQHKKKQQLQLHQQQPSEKKEDAEQEGYTSIWNGLVRVAREEGIPVLWSGAVASLMLVSNPTIQFVLYDKFRKIAVNRAKGKGRSLSSLEFFLIGAIAKAISTIVTYPIQVAQTALRHGGGRGGKGNASGAKPAADGAKPQQQQRQFTSTLDFLTKVFKKEGIAGWFKGLDVKLVQTVLMAAFHFMCYESIAGLIFRIFGKGK